MIPCKAKSILTRREGRYTIIKTSGGIPFFRGRQGRKLADDLRNCPRLDREKLKRLADKERARILASMEDDK